MSKRRRVECLECLLLTLLFGLGAAGCTDFGNTTDYWDFHDVDPAGWRRDDAVRFHPWPETDTVAPGSYDLILVVRHTDAYPASKLSLRVETVHADGHATADTVALRLSDESGKWLGKGNRTLYEVYDTIARGSRGYTPVMTDYVYISHCMDTVALPGINKLGLMLVRRK